MTDTLPLFTYLYNPLDVYVIDNNLIAMRYGVIGYHYTPYKAFELLKQLFRNAKNKTLSERFEKYFQEEELTIIKKEGYEYPRVYGLEDAGFCNNCLDWEIAFCENKDKSVIFKDFVYQYQIQQKTLEYQLSFTFDEAFHYLANICVTAASQRFLTLYKHSTKTKLSFSEMFDGKQRYSEVFACFTDIFKFSLEYLDYIAAKLDNGDITPYELVRINGPLLVSLFFDKTVVKDFIAETLDKLENNISELTRNQKILYYSFLEITRHTTEILAKDLHQELEQFKLKNKSKIGEIEKELFISFPLEDI